MPLIVFFTLLAVVAGAIAGGDHLRGGTIAGDQYEYIQLTRPLSTDALTASCTAAVFSHSFANTAGLPPATTSHSPPRECPGPWYAAVIDISAACDGPQRGRIAAVWLDGVELLRTSSPAPGGDGGRWVVRKDITAYSSVLRRINASIAVMLENAVDEVYTGVYYLNISMLYYISGNNASIVNDSKIKVYEGFDDFVKSNWDDSFDDKEDNNVEEVELASLIQKNAVRARELGVEIEKIVGQIDANQSRMGLSNKPADLIIPISSNGKNGFWFKIRDGLDVFSKSVTIPPNTYQAMLEIFLSFHLDDELWYADPPWSFAGGHGTGAFRRVFVVVDGIYAGSVVPFPVVNAKGINPLFWQPIVGIGVFDLPSYKLELTPFLGMFLDGRPHTIGIGVEEANNFWLVDANLHLWLDHNSIQVYGKLVQYRAPPLRVSRKYKVKKLINGKFKIKAKHKTQFSGWVISTLGNLTTHVINELKFKNKIKINGHKDEKEVEQSVKISTEIRLEAYSVLLFAQLKQETKFSFEMESSIQPGFDFTKRVNSELSNELKDQSTLTLPSGLFSDWLKDEQEALGWMLVKDEAVVDGATTTEQKYNYFDNNNQYSRKVIARGGKLLSYNFTDVITTPTSGQIHDEWFRLDLVS